MEKPGEDKEKMEELFTDELALAIATIARWLVINNEETFQKGKYINDENK